MFSRNYVQDLSSQLIPLWGLTVAAVGLSFAALLLPGRMRRGIEWVHVNGNRLWAVTAMALCAAFSLGLWVRPYMEPFQVSASGQRTYNEQTPSEWRGISRRRGWWLHSVAY